MLHLCQYLSQMIQIVLKTVRFHSDATFCRILTRYAEILILALKTDLCVNSFFFYVSAFFR
jgi:hypothetical protein